MSCILYYSNYCEVCKKYLKLISNAGFQKDIHFICIDKRVEKDGKTFIVLENGQRIVLPSNINRVPALLLLLKGYKVLFGEQILEHLQPMSISEVKVATQNNMEPTAFTFDSMSSSSDNFSFITENPQDLKISNEGMKQMKNYATINDIGIISSDIPSSERQKYEQMNTKSNKIPNDENGDILSKISMQRDRDVENIFGKRPPMNAPMNNSMNKFTPDLPTYR
jgi:hypothetical protein